MAVLNSNPEILLRKRKNTDRKRLEKQEQAREKALQQKNLKKKQLKNKFIRAETLVSNYKSNELERKRIRNISKSSEEGELKYSEEELKEYKLLFVIRIQNHTKGLKIPAKARQVLDVLKLTEKDTGVFVKASPLSMDLLSLVAPYIMVGKPSLSSIRKLFQKRARIISTEQLEEGDDEERIVKLDNNQVVEDKFGNDLGLICIEDLIHEIVSLSPNFTSITSWLLPFKLNPPVHGWGPQAKLAKLIYASENKTTISLSRDFKLSEVEDIDNIIDQQNWLDILPFVQYMPWIIIDVENIIRESN